MSHEKEAQISMMSRRSASRLPATFDKAFFDSDEFEDFTITAKKSGLSSYSLLALSSWIESEEIDDTKKLEIIECLIPKIGGIIPVKIIIEFTYLLKVSDISLTIKVELLKWMTCVYPFMEKGDTFHMLYESFLGLLKVEEVRPYAAYFINLITEAKHVTTERVKFIFNYISKYGKHNCFLMILRTYFFYMPEAFDDEIRDEDLYEPESLGVYPNLIKNVHHAYEPNFSNSQSFSLESPSAGVSTESHVTEKVSYKSMPFHELYRKFTALEQCNNISKILASGLRRLFLTSKLDKKTEIKVHDYIISLLFEEMDSENVIEKYFEILRLQHSIPGISEFNQFLLMQEDYYPDTVEVMCNEPIYCFKHVEFQLKDIRRKILITDDVAIKCQWLLCLSRMYCNWVLQSKKFVPCDGKCFENDTLDDESSSATGYHIPIIEINKLSSAIDLICDSLLMDETSPFVLYEILMHYEMGTIACIRMENFSPCFPSCRVFQLSLFSLSPIILDTLSKLIIRVGTLNSMQTCELSSDEFMILQAMCSDIRKIFFGGSYENKASYLATKNTFQELTEISPTFRNVFMFYNHPALLLARKEFGFRNDLKNVINDQNKMLDYANCLAANGLKYFAKLLGKIMK